MTVVYLLSLGRFVGMVRRIEDSNGIASYHREKEREKAIKAKQVMLKDRTTKYLIIRQNAEGRMQKTADRRQKYIM